MGLSPYTVMPFYLKHFTDSKVLIGMIPAIYIIGNTLPQPFMANFLRKKAGRKRYLATAAIAQRFGILGLLVLTIIQPNFGLSDSLTILLFFSMFVIQTVASGFYVPAWIDFLGKSIPEKRGMLFGVSNFFGGLLGIGLGWLLTYLLENFPYYQAMPTIFAIAFGASMVSLIAILSWRETIPPQENPDSGDEVKNHLAETLKNSNFIKFLIWRGLLVILEIATPFYTLAALEISNVSAAQVGVFTLILSLSETILNPLWGWLGDRNGFLHIVVIAASLGTAAAFMAATSANIFIFYLVFFLTGAMISGLQISNFNLIYEFSPANMVPAYIAISQLALSPLSGLMPVVGGLLITQFGYAADFWVTGLVSALSLLGMKLTVKNPKNSTVAKNI